ncbi:MAG: ribose-phosphate diphosphokinase [Oceanidesulfovibrio sp.]
MDGHRRAQGGKLRRVAEWFTGRFDEVLECGYYAIMITLLYCPQMEPLARRIAEADSRFNLGTVQWKAFADGYPDLWVENMECMRNSDVAMLASFDSPADIFPQLSLIYEAPRYGLRSFKVVLPYFPTGTMERVDRDGRIATAATLARMLSVVPMTISGASQILIYDIHALQERFYFSDQVIPRLETALPLVKREIARLDDPIVVFPDDGASKRFGRIFDEFDQAVCMKKREDGARTIFLREGDPAGRHAVIIDDLVQSGSTLIAAKDMLTRSGAERVSAYVTHGVFPNQSWRRFLDAGFETFWLTDSCPRAIREIEGTPPFQVLSLADSIRTILIADM